MGLTNNSHARRFLLHELSNLPLDDPLLIPILESFSEHPLTHGAEIIVDILENSKNTKTKLAAIGALVECSSVAVLGTLRRVAQTSPSRELRIAAMDALLYWVNENDINWLQDRFLKKDKYNLALKLLFVIALRHGSGTQGRQAFEVAYNEAISALHRPRGERAQIAASHAHLLGSRIAPKLLDVCRNPKAEIQVRRSACVSLGKIGYRDATDYLSSMVYKYPDEKIQEADDMNESSIAIDAAGSLALIDPERLLKIKGETSKQALLWFSATTGHLVFEDHILDPAGKRINKKDGALSKDYVNQKTLDMTIKDVDVAIVIALKEEFHVLFQYISKDYNSITDEKTGRSFYLFQHHCDDGIKSYNCVAVFAGDMGPEVAGQVTQRLIELANPRIVINLGICAGDKSEVNIGDVIIPTQVKMYAHAVKIQKSPQINNLGIFKPGGLDIDTSYDLVKQLENFPYTYPEHYKNWKQGCRHRFGGIRPTEQRLKLLEKGLLHKQAKEVVGILASGPFVNQSEDFFKWILAQNRKVIGLEMEAGVIMTAIRERIAPTQSLILRAVSDYGDKSKKTLDKIGGGVLRKYAMQNSISLLWRFMDVGLLPKKEGNQ